MNQGRHAVVLGGSLAGLLAARVLSKHFNAVTLVERDEIVEAPQSRKGQPQTRHGHGLLAKGYEILAHYFPELPADLAAGGAVFGDMALDVRWHAYGGRRLQFPSGLHAACASRPFLEFCLRRRLQGLPKVSVLDRADVHRLVVADGGRRVCGVAVQRRGEDNREETLPADLIVDATGRGSAAPRWLEALGFGRPTESAVRIHMNYATRTFRRQPGDLPDAKFMVVAEHAPEMPRSGFVLPLEGDRWMVTLTARGASHPARDGATFLEFARSLAAPDVHQFLLGVEPLTEVVHHAIPSNLRRHYEKMPHFPDGFLVLGDAVCSFNPVYGQGMTSAALQAATLDHLLTERGGGRVRELARPYFQRIARIVDTPWMMAVAEDFRFPKTEGSKPMGVEILNRYLDGIHRATHHDPVVYGAFLQVMNLLRSPNSLLAPRILGRVLTRRHVSLSACSPAPPCCRHAP